MRKITLIPLVLGITFFAGCANYTPYKQLRTKHENFLYDRAMKPVHAGTSWGRGNFRKNMADHVVEPKASMANPRAKKYYGRHSRNSNLPRYHVTTEEQTKYQELNKRLERRTSTNNVSPGVKTDTVKQSSEVPTIPVKTSSAQ